VTPGEINIVVGALLSVKLKSGGASAGWVLVVLELTELDAVDELAAALEDVVVLDDVVALAELAELEEVVEEAFCAGLG